MLHLDLQIACEEAGVPKAASFQSWVTQALDIAEEDRREVTLRVVGEEESQALNHRYRGKNKPTNVLSFPFETIPGIEEAILGDVVICKSLVEQEARTQNKLPESHWAHLVIHGILHLCGYDHIAAEEADQMESLEIEALSGLGYPDPYK
ncbi:MAG: rRNA maturation RNase YbeY [Acidiferrobacterales bacterium]|nr:rRNA maturation RNase YbeY [Acidiferrobacterales bacterium]